MGFMDVRRYSYEFLKSCANNFSEENLIGEFQFGKVYHGTYVDVSTRKITDLTIKVWEDPKEHTVCHSENKEGRLLEEVLLLKDESMVSHPNLMRLKGYCREGEHLGVLYVFKALDTVQNLLHKESFTWIQRVKVALQLACLLKFLHTPYGAQLPYLVRNLDAAHLLLDKDYNVKLFDFGLISGGIFRDRRKKNHNVHGCQGYIGPRHRAPGAWLDECDVYAYGVILLLLLTKGVSNVENDLLNLIASSSLDERASSSTSEYEQLMSRLGCGNKKFSLVHKSFKEDSYFYSSDGPKLTELALLCVNSDPSKRPTMKQVVKYLLRLNIVKRHADILKVKQILRDNAQKSKPSGLRRYLSILKINLGRTC